MTINYKKIILLILFSASIIYINFRLSTALPGLKVVIRDLQNIIVNNKNYTYSQKIEHFWKNDYRYSELVGKIVDHNETVNFGNNISDDVLHPNIIANFVYPVKLTATTSGISSYEALYPGTVINSETCSHVYIFNIEESSYSEIKCSDYFANKEEYKKSLGLIKK